MHFRIIIPFIITLFLSVPLSAEESVTMSQVQDALKRAEDLNIEMPKGIDTEAEIAAKEAAAYINSEEFEKRLNKERKRIKKILFKGENKPQFKPELASNDRIYIFISSSIPRETLRSYIRDIDHLNESNITMVLRGFVGGIKKYKPTHEFIKSLVTKDKDCDISDTRCQSYRANIDIDPMAFRHFNIDKVPAVVYAEDLKLFYPDKSIGEKDNIESTGEILQFYGDMPLKYIFRRFSEKNKKFDKLVSKLEQRGFYFE